VGDLRRVLLPGGEKEWELLEIDYPAHSGNDHLPAAS
jgi:hypothetical protein